MSSKQVSTEPPAGANDAGAEGSHESLRELAARYRIVSDYTYDWEFWLAPDGHFLYSSPSCERITGCTAEMFLADPTLHARLVHPDDRERFVAHRHEVEDAQTGGEGEWRLVRPDGTYRWVAHICQPVFDEAGKFLGVRGCNRDITDRKTAQESLWRENREIILANRVLRIFAEEADEEVFDKALAVVQEGMGSRHGVFGYILQPGHLICPSLSKMLDTCEIEGKCIHYPPEKWKGLWARALTEKRSRYTNESPPVPPGHPIIRNNLAAPILFRGEAIGLLNLANKDGGYSDEDRQALVGIAARIAPVLYAWIQRKLREDERKAAAESLQKAHAELERRVAERTAQLHRTTELVRAERKRFYEVLETLPVYVCLLSPDYQMPFANKVFREWFGYDPERKCYEFLFERSRPCENCMTFTVLRTNLPQRWEWTGPNGRDYDIFDFPFIDTDGSPLVLEMGIDITERNQAENAIKELNETLEQRVARRTAQLRCTAEELRRSNEDLQQFAYISSHDLQEPLRMVNSFLKLLDHRYRPQLDDKARQYIAFAVEGATRMSHLISDLLDYSRVDRLEGTLAPMDAGASLRAALDNLQGAIQEEGAAVACEELPTVYGDASQIMQLFQNLVANAIKFRAPDRPCQVHVSARRAGRKWEFAVRDNGIGIPRDAYDDIFVIFQRLHTREQYPGTGIGLAICKRIVERHGGWIWVESRLGEGTTFFFTLPEEKHD